MPVFLLYLLEGIRLVPWFLRHPIDAEKRAAAIAPGGDSIHPVVFPERIPACCYTVIRNVQRFRVPKKGDLDEILRHRRLPRQGERGLEC